ncbi:hypothetical protein [Legionella worsleiensis]|uniref:Uncharacterized protein n=1 Tax=Legionella worsleiensis TaxID=45076 RepID=A0A0W1AK83_9GAMM|nr:hypothetical protein [Legionella worsleiensis]KTD81772.1 hypothetical protein Lwor_0075 [Legionella worsleiensis]STY31154.1 Uncharacterised protein [Legionella worsleiensis]
MNKIFRHFFVLFTFISSLANATAVKDGVFIDTMILTDYVVNDFSKSDESGKRTDSFSKNDPIIFYYAIIGVINPTKKMYDVKVVCVDSKGNPVLQSTVKQSLSGFTRHVGGDIIKGYTQTLSMDPKVGAMVKDQIVPLKNGDYYIKLYFENKLIGITRFDYSVIN